MIYNVNYFIKKFEAIPEDQWTTGSFRDEHGRKCALGHCLTLHEEQAALISLLRYTTSEINDGERDRYQQPTPKQRILAALNDVKNETF